MRAPEDATPILTPPRTAAAPATYTPPPPSMPAHAAAAGGAATAAAVAAAAMADAEDGAQQPQQGDPMAGVSEEDRAAIQVGGRVCSGGVCDCGAGAAATVAWRGAGRPGVCLLPE